MEKFPENLLVWIAMSEDSFSQSYFGAAKHALNGALYREECIKKRLKPWLDTLYNDGDYCFWPNLALNAKEMRELFSELGIKFFPKSLNPPNCPQICSIERFGGIFKGKVYQGGYEAKNLDALKHRVREKIKEVDFDLAQSLFSSLTSERLRTKVLW